MISLFAFDVASADIEINGVLDPKLMVTRIDSVEFTPPDTTFLTPGWSSENGLLDTFTFTGVTVWPQTLVFHGLTGPYPFHQVILHPDTSTCYNLCFGVHKPMVKFYGTGYGGVEESRPVVAPLPRLTVSPSVVTGQMTVRLRPVGTSRPVVWIHDAVGNVIRTLGCTAGADGAATATWNREGDHGRLVPEGVYFCRYSAADVIAVRKVLVAR